MECQIDMPDRMSEDMTDRIPEDMPNRMSEDMPDRMPDRMLEDMTDRPSEDLPDRICQMESQTEFQIECQKICQTECQMGWIECHGGDHSKQNIFCWTGSHENQVFSMVHGCYMATSTGPHITSYPFGFRPACDFGRFDASHLLESAQIADVSDV